MQKVHPTIKGRQRFYKHVTVRELPPAAANNDESQEGGPKYEIALDGRSLRTPGRRPMHFDSAELAWGVAAEWDAQVRRVGSLWLMSLSVILVAMSIEYHTLSLFLI
jgi:chaperone required for assembly of F1-ATPase